MKKFIFALMVGLLMVAALATVASADNGPHGGFTNTTAKCAGCHRAHSAQSDDGFLLVATDVFALCTSCHNGNGAATNVVDGVLATGGVGDAGRPLFGGGFVNTATAHTWNGKEAYDANAAWPASTATTSTHTVKGLGTSIGAGTVWGSGNINTTDVVWDGTKAELECTSCHDPHGRAGRTQAGGAAFTASNQGGVPTGLPMPSYRLLRFTPSGSNGFEVTGSSANWWAVGNVQSSVGITVRETTNIWYTINTDVALDGTVAFFSTRWDGTQYTPWGSYIAQKGDAAGRLYVYQRPANVVGGPLSNGVVSSIVTCADANGNLPALPAAQLTTAAVAGVNYFPCAATTGTLFNNNKNGANLTAGRAQLGYWCGTCHDRYVSGNANGLSGRTTSSGDSYYTFRHNTATSLACVDCHFAHGTSSVMTSTNASYPTASRTTGSILMKTDERSVCLKCHGHSVNFDYTQYP